MRLQQVLFAAVSFLTLAQAWPWPHNMGEGSLNAVHGLEGLLFRRADGGSTTATNTGTAGPTKTAGSTSGSGSNKASITSGKGASATGSSSGGSKTIDGDDGNNGNSSATTEYDPRMPAGGIQMITPAAISGAQYYKIGDWVTFAWNYTSLEATPSAVNIVASCSQNQATYTLAMNQSVQQTGGVLWDTGAYQKTATVPLLTNTYTLIVWDSSQSISAVPKAGYLGSSSQFTFGMYVPQPYTPLSGYQCPTCSGALSPTERLTLTFLFGMAGITVFSFTWFASSFSLF